MAKAQLQSIQLSLKQRHQLEAVLLEFDRKWSPDALVQFAKRLSGSESLRKTALVELACVDLEQLWASGETRHVEDYLSQFPELGSPSDAPAELIHGEYQARLTSDQPLEIDELKRRFPAQAEQVLQLIEQARDSQVGEQQADDSAVKASVDTSRRAEIGDTTPVAPATGATLPEQFGRYQIVRQLGAGAMGAVYLAHDTQLDRQVALKTPSLDDAGQSQELVERFYREARSAATLRHPNICPVHDVGEIDGTHYITMSYIEGRPLSSYTNSDKPIPPRTAAIIVRKLAQALAAAHAEAVVHRDLKPANVMIDQNREPVVMDFGLARRDSGVEQSRMTQSGMILGTPAYMSPEQVQGKQDEIGPATDQYSLGVMLYEMLGGQLPFRGSIAAVIGQIMTQEPPRPSELRDGIDPALEAICLKMMAKSSAERYVSMNEVAEAIGEWLKSTSDSPSSIHRSAKGRKVGTATTPAAANASIAGQQEQLQAYFTDEGKPSSSAPALSPTVAVPTTQGATSPAGRLNAAFHRLKHSKPLLIAGAALPVILLLGIVLLIRTPKGTVHVEVNDPQLEVLVNGEAITIKDNCGEESLKAGTHRLAIKFGDVNIPLGKTVRLTTADYNGQYRVAVSLGDKELVGEKFTVVRGENPVLIVSLIRDLEQKTATSPPPVPQDIKEPIATGKRWEPGPTESALTGLIPRPAVLEGLGRWQVETLQPHSQINAVDWSRDGKYIVCGTHAGCIRLYDAESMELVQLFLGHENSVKSVIFSPTGERIASLGDGSVRIWDLGGKAEAVWNREGIVESIAWSPDGSQLATCGADFPQVHVWSATDQPRVLLDLEFGPLHAVAWSPDGKRIAVAEHSTVSICSLADGTKEVELKGHKGFVTSVAWHPDGNTLATSSDDGGIRLWGSDGTPIKVIERLGDRATSVTWSPDGQWLATIGRLDNGVRIWRADGSDGPRWHRSTQAISVAWSPDSTRLVWGTHNSNLSGGIIQVSQLDGSLGRTIEPLPTDVYSIAWNRQGTLLAAGRDKTVRLWSPDGAPRSVLEGPQSNIRSVAWHPDGEQVTAGTGDGHVRTWKSDGTAGPSTKSDKKAVRAVSWSPDGKRFASGDYDGRIRIFDEQAKLLSSLGKHGDGVFALAWSPDGQILASGGLDQTIRICKPDGTEAGIFTGHEAYILSLDWCPDGRWLASAGSYDKTVRLWRPDGTKGPILEVEHHGPRAVCWSPDGKWIASGDGHGNVRLWNMLRGGTPGPVYSHRGQVESVDWSPDGKWLASGSYEGTVLVHDARTGEPAWTAVLLDGAKGAVFSAAGQLLYGDQEAVEGQLVYVVEQDDSRLEMLKPSEFQKRVEEGNRRASSSVLNEKLLPVLPASPSKRLPGLVGDPAELPGIDRWQMETVRPRAWLRSVAVSPDGRWIACGSGIGVIRIYEAQTFALVRVFLGNTQDAAALCWHPDSQRLASLGSGDPNVVRIWHLNGKQEQVIQFGAEEITSISWHPNGAQLALASEEGRIRLWEADRRRTRILHEEDIEFIRIDFSPDGTRIATGDNEGDVRIWTVNGELIRTIEAHSEQISALAWSPDNDRLATAGGKIARIWDSQGNLSVELPEQQDGVLDVAWSPGSAYLGTTHGNAHDCKIWKADGTLVTEVKPWGILNALAWNPAGEQFVIAGSHLQSVGLDGTARNSLSVSIRGDGGGGWSLAWSPDGQYLAKGASGTPVWNADGSLSRMMGMNGFLSTTWGPGNRLAINDWKNDKVPIQIYDLQGRKGPALSLSPPRKASAIWCVSKDLLAVTASSGKLLFWEPGSPPNDEVHAHDGSFLKSWSPDGSLLATGGREDQIVKLWKPDGSLVRVLGEHEDAVTALAWSPDGTKIAAAAADWSRPIRIWSADGSSTQDIPTKVFGVVALAWRPDRPEIIVASHAGASIQSYRLDGQRMWQFQADTGLLNAMDCSPDGKRIAATGLGGTLSVYDADSQSPLWRSVCVNHDDRAYINIDSTGHLIYGDPGQFRREFVFIVEKDGVQQTLSCDEFSQRFDLNLLKPPASPQDDENDQ